ncbi:MAG: MotA/TolQ/ExbB proton channel family protein [Methanophagales archaeon ANME-1-THS]|nr:MAG: MotA/TolQ/ExbB proton channel family protein [Methanophagales archaeon ANME-1-THS]
MNALSWISTEGLTFISSILRYPVLIVLYGLAMWAIVESGMVTAEWLTRRKHERVRIEDMDKGLLEAREEMKKNFDAGIQKTKESASGKFVDLFLDELSKLRDDDLFEVRLERLIQKYEAWISKRLQRTITMVRIGPMLGLMGTLVPMGPALLALSQGDVNTLATKLIYAFGTTVLGLLVGGIAYVITAVRQHWYRLDMDDIRYICEILFGG